MDKQSFITQLAELKPSSTFLSLRNYKNSSGEIADYSIVFHMSYEQALKKSLEIISQYVPANELEQKSKDQLITSYEKSLDKIEIQPMEEVIDGYQHFKSDGQFIKGIKVHIETGNIHIYGLLNKKIVKTPGEYKDKSRSNELAKVKSRLSKELPVSKFRQFIVSPDRVEYIAVSKLTLLPPDN